MGPGGKGRASCRHTVPDWARYVRDPGEGWPIVAACRLLVKEEEPAGDARTIACGFWGRQGECPLYEGAGEPAVPPSRGPAEPSRPEQPLTAQQMAAARLASDDYAPRGPLTDVQRQRRRASAALVGLLVALAALAVWWVR